VATITDQARQILTSLEAKPTLLYELLRIVSDEYMIVGPWVAVENQKISGDYYYERRSIEGESIGQVARLPASATTIGWQWQVAGGNSGKAASITDAQADVDAELTDIGWMLA